MKARRFQITPPEKQIDYKEGARLLAQSASASASYETVVFQARNSVQVDAALLAFEAAIGTVTVGSAAATLFLNIWRAIPSATVAYQISNDGALGAFSFNVVAASATPKNLQLSLQALAPTAVQPASSFGQAYGLSGLAFVGYISSAVSSTGTTMTVAAVGNNALTTLESTAILNGGTFRMLVDPGTANAEFVTVSAFNTSTGVTTNTAFANSHSAGALVVIPGAYLFQGTQSGAVTANTTTGNTITAISPSNIAQPQIGIGAWLTVEPGTTNEETVPIGAYNTGTGVYTIASSYNGGKFASAHSAGASVAVKNYSQTSSPNQLQSTSMNSARELAVGDIVTAKWVQSATTGLALPAARLDLDYSFSGYRA